MNIRKKIIPIQRTEKGLIQWETQGVGRYPQAICKSESFNEGTNEVAIVIGFSREILNDVKEYLLEEKKTVGRIINVKLPTTDSSNVVDGVHAWHLANQIKNLIDKRSLSEKKNILHLFMACPNSVVFLLGRYSLPFGKTQLYEYDFLKQRTNSYYPTLMFPIEKIFQ